MRTSVAMCTYNGQNYIEEQLRSILEQSIPIDEIVICAVSYTHLTLPTILRV